MGILLVLKAEIVYSRGHGKSSSDNLSRTREGIVACDY